MRRMIPATLCLVGLIWVMPCTTLAAQSDQETFGCKSIANTTQVLALRQNTDQTDSDTRLQRLVRAGECRMWTATDAVTVEDESDGLVCLAPNGVHRSCYWSAPRSGRLAR